MPRRHRKDTEGKTNWFAPIVVSVIMGSVAFTMSDPAATRDETDDHAATSTVSVGQTSTTRIRVGVRAPNADRDALFLVDLANGDARVAEVAAGWRVEEMRGTPTLRLAGSDERGAVLTDGADWNVMLRAPTGEAYSDVRVLGLFDERHAAVLARTDRFYVLDVARDGRIAVVADIPEEATVIGFSGGAAWISTFTSGEGIESEPTGPSRVIRVTGNGSSVIGTDEARVIVGALSDGSRHAYWSDERFYAIDGGRTFTGRGRPLLWLDDGTLLVAKGVTLEAHATDGSSRVFSTAFPAAPVAAETLR